MRLTPGRNQEDRSGDVAQFKIIEKKSKRIFAAIIIFRNNKYVYMLKVHTNVSKEYTCVLILLQANVQFTKCTFIL